MKEQSEQPGNILERMPERANDFHALLKDTALVAMEQIRDEPAAKLPENADIVIRWEELAGEFVIDAMYYFGAMIVTSASRASVFIGRRVEEIINAIKDDMGDFVFPTFQFDYTVKTKDGEDRPRTLYFFDTREMQGAVSISFTLDVLNAFHSVVGRHFAQIGRAVISMGNYALPGATKETATYEIIGSDGEILTSNEGSEEAIKKAGARAFRLAAAAAGEALPPQEDNIVPPVKEVVNRNNKIS